MRGATPVSPACAQARLKRCLAALALASICAAPALSQARATYTLDDLKRVEAARDAALGRLRALETSSAKAERDAFRIDADLIAAAADSRRREETATDAERALARLEQEAAIARADLLDDETSLSDVLAALMSLGARRPPALAASPEATGDAVRAAILMSEAAPALAARANTIRSKIVTLNAIMTATRREQAVLEEQEAALNARRIEIEALAVEKRMSRGALVAETAALVAETQRLASEADTLRQLLDGLARTAPATPGRKPGQKPPQKPAVAAPGPAAQPIGPTAASASAPLPPVVGRPLRRFGRTIAGQRQTGTTYAARAGAQVVAPQDAHVEFAGVFRSYGQMLILDMGDGILVVVSGLDAIYAEAGQWVLAGEPIGRMASQTSGSPELYLEVRKDGEPIDPGKWLGQGA